MSISALEGIGNEHGSRRLVANPRYGLFIQYGIIAFIVLALGWMAYFSIDELVRGEAKVVPSGEVRVVQHLEGGVVKGILVKAGERVEQGQPLVVMSSDRAMSDREEVRAELSRVALLINRSEALLGQAVLREDFDLAGLTSQDLRAHVASFHAERNRFASEIGAAESDLKELRREREGVSRSLDDVRLEFSLAYENLSSARDLEKLGALSSFEVNREEREVLSLRREISGLESRLDELEHRIGSVSKRKDEVQRRFESDQWERLNELYGREGALREALNVADGALRRSTLHSPVSGYVKQIFVNTLDGVVQPGAPVAEVVPAEEDLILEAKIDPKDVGFIREGMPAVVKVTAFDFTIYGGLDGVVDLVSPDSIVEEDRVFYKVRIRVQNAYEQSPHIILRPGMMASVDVITGHRTILAYIGKPILRGLRESLGER